MSANLKAQIIQLIDQMPGSFAALPGEVFSTGALSLAPGDLYIAGLNPGRGSSYPANTQEFSDLVAPYLGQ